jgi:hypothetical protein
MPYFTNRGIVPLAAEPSSTTWDPADAQASAFIYSNGDLTVTDNTGGAGRGVHSTSGQTSGKWYWEVVLDNQTGGGGTVFAGLADSGLINFLGLAANEISIGNSDNVYIANSGQGSIGTWEEPAGNASFAWDADNEKLWIRVDGGQWNGNAGSNDPATNTGGYDISSFTGPLYAAISTFTDPDALTGKFSSSSWSHAAPSGFSQFP